MTGNLDMNNNKLTSLADSTDDNDAVTFKVIKRSYSSSVKIIIIYNLVFKIYKNFGDRRKIG